MRLRAIIFFAVLLSSSFAFASAVLRYYPVNYSEYVNENAGGLERSVVYAVIHAESKFRPDAVSKKGAVGLMQVTEATAEWTASLMGMDGFEIGRLTEPAVNIAIGCFFLNWLVDYYGGDLNLALAAYNAGLGNVNRWLADENHSLEGTTLHSIPFRETEQYLKRVRLNKRVYDALLFFHWGIK